MSRNLIDTPVTPAPVAIGFGRGSVAVGVAVFAWLVLTAGLRPLALPDEGRYVQVAREMLVSGDWLTPKLEGLPYFHKPPLFYWLTAASMAVFGQNELAARAAPIVGGWIAAMALFFFARRWQGERPARFALVALLSMPLVYGGAQYANMDMLVAGFITASVLLLAHVSQSLAAGLPYRTALVGAYVCAALGVLAKGLIGAALPILVVVAWLLLARRTRHIVPMLSIAGLAAFALVALPWFVALQLRFPGFLDYFFVVQQVQRFAAGGYNNVRPFWFYVAVVAAASLPWLPWLRWPHRPRLAHAPVRLLMIVWPVAITVFFSIPKSKIPGYILPALPPLAWLLADTLFAAGGEPTARARRGWAASAIVSTLLGLAVVIGLAIHPIRSARPLGIALAHEAAPSASVFLLRDAYFDLPFYAGLRGAPRIVDDWDTPSVRERDNWRKELADAADFERDVVRSSAPSPLVTPADLPRRLCARPMAWLVGPPGAAKSSPFLQFATALATTPDAVLWKLDPARADVAAALGCTAR